MDSVLKVGIDLHGVLTEYPNEMKMILRALRKMGVIVSIVSGPKYNEIERELKDLGFEFGKHYVHINSVVDFLITSGVKMWQDENEDWWASDEEWWSSKAMICKRYGIDVLIDDSPRYKPAFNLIDCKYVDFYEFILEVLS